MQFKRATKKQARARVAIDGPSGSGKTYSALIAATVLAAGGRIAVIDTERGSASLYADTFTFDVLELTTFDPRLYIEAIQAAEQAGYSVIVIDSLSHAWEGEGGALDQVDKAAKRQQGNSFAAWKDVTPLQRRMVDAMLQSKCHIIATMRSKMDYVQEKDEKSGRTIIRKVGMAPVQRQGIEYEFTITADMDTDHNLVVSKSRCSELADAVVNRPGPDFWQRFVDWLNSGEPAAESTPTTPAPAVPTEEPPAVPAVAAEGPPARSAAETIDALRLQSKKYYRQFEDQPPPTNQFTLFVSLLSRAAGDDARRMTFLREVWQIKESSKELTRRQVAATLDWLDPQEYQDEHGKMKYRIGNENAAEELSRVVDAAVQRGMEALPGMEPEEEPEPELEALPF